MSVIKVISIFLVLIVVSDGAYVPAPFTLHNLNIQSVSVNGSFFNFMNFNFNGNLKLIYLCEFSS